MSVDQLFPVPADAASFALTTERGAEKNNCIGIVGSALALVPCDTVAASQKFAIANGGKNEGNPPAQDAPTITSISTTPNRPTQAPAASSVIGDGCTITTLANPSTVTIIQTVTVAAAATTNTGSGY